MRWVKKRKWLGLCGSKWVEREELCDGGKLGGELVSVVKMGGAEFWCFDEEIGKWQIAERPEEGGVEVLPSDARFREDVAEHKQKQYAQAEKEKEKIRIED